MRDRPLNGALVVTRASFYLLDSHWGSYFSPLARGDSILMGCAFALSCEASPAFATFWKNRTGILVSGTCAGALIVCSFFIGHLAAGLYLGGFTLIALYAAVVISHISVAHEGAMARFLSQKWFVEIGKRSYGIYLFHIPIFKALLTLRAKGWDPMAISVMQVTLSGCFAWLSYKYVESPILNWSRLSQGSAGNETPNLSAAETGIPAILPN